MTTHTEGATLTEDTDAVLMAQELAQQLQLLKELAQHPAINRAAIARHRAAATDLLQQLQVHMLVAVYA